MDRTTLYREQAAYCADLLTRVRDPKRRALVEQERQDWLLLAMRGAEGRRAERLAEEPRSFSPKRDHPKSFDRPPAQEPDDANVDAHGGRPYPEGGRQPA